VVIDHVGGVGMDMAFILAGVFNFVTEALQWQDGQSEQHDPEYV